MKINQSNLILLLSVCPLLSDAKYQVTCEHQANSDNVFFQQSQEQAKCINGSNSLPELDRGIMNVDLSRWHEGQGYGCTNIFIRS